MTTAPLHADTPATLRYCATAIMKPLLAAHGAYDTLTPSQRQVTNRVRIARSRPELHTSPCNHPNPQRREPT